MNRTKMMSASKTAAVVAATAKNQQRHSKRDDATMLSLREELQLLYKSLQHKNEELIVLERIILERDTTINGLNKECQRLSSGGGGGGDGGVAVSQKVKRNSGASSANTTSKLFSLNIESDRMAKQSEIATERSDASSTVKTSDVELIREQNETIKELNEKVLRLTRNLNMIQRNLQSKEDRIIELQTEIDKFRQIVRPITKAMVEKRTCDCMDEWSNYITGIGDWSPGIESTRVLPVSEPRIKRQAISAEPLSALAQISEEDGLVRIPKSSL